MSEKSGCYSVLEVGAASIREAVLAILQEPATRQLLVDMEMPLPHDRKKVIPWSAESYQQLIVTPFWGVIRIEEVFLKYRELLQERDELKSELGKAHIINKNATTVIEELQAEITYLQQARKDLEDEKGVSSNRVVYQVEIQRQQRIAQGACDRVTELEAQLKRLTQIEGQE